MRSAVEILADLLSRDPHALDSLFPNSSYSSVFSPEFLNAEIANILLILNEMTSEDPSVRFMATLDLLNELNKEEFKVDGDPEIILSKSILQRLDDRVSIVSDSAMKCIAPLVRKVSIATLVEMTKKLCDKLLRKEERNRDVAGIALKTMLSEASDLAAVDIVLCGLKPVLIRGIMQSGMTTKIKCECLDLLCHVLLNYGTLQANYNEMLVGVLLSELNLNEANVGRRVVSCMASLASCLSGDLMEKAVCKVVELLKRKSTEVEIKNGYIQMIVSLSLAAGNCFGRHLVDVVPLLLEYSSITAETDELRDYSLQALESFLLKCPRHIPSYCDKILDRTLELLSYDPNFTGDMVEDTNDENGAEDEDDENADEYTDDEDSSWKVRRAALKCLAGLIVSRPQMLGKLYEEACPKLIDRFKEREESVKMDVFSTFIKLLRQTGIRGDMDTDECRLLLTQKVSNIVKAINEQLRGKSVKTKAGAFAVLKELAVVLPDCLFAELPRLALQIETTLLNESSTSSMKIGALDFTRTVLVSGAAAGVSFCAIKAIFAPILSAAAEPNHIVAAEALRVCGALVCSLHLNTEVEHVHEIYRAIIPQLTAQVENQEVKECAISCMALLISNFGDKISKKLPECLPVLVDRMCDDELTSLATVKAFSVIAASKLRLELSCVLEYHVMEGERLTTNKSYVIAKLTTFIRQDNWTLRQAALETLNSIFVAYAIKRNSSSYKEIIQELSELISDSDLHTAPALELCVTLMNSNRALFSIVKDKILPRSLTLLSRSLLNARALSALNRCLTSLVNSGVMVFMTLLNRLLLCANTLSQSNGTAQSSGNKRQALLSISQCIAALCLAVDEGKCLSAVKRLTNIINEQEHTNDYSAKQHLALLCLCEMGRKKDLTGHTNIAIILIASISSPFDEIKSAASYALGNIAVGDFPKYFPILLANINKDITNRYFFLHSLREVIVRKSVEKPQLQSSSVDNIISLLFNYFENEEKGVRDVVAECLGKIALIEPAKLVPALKAQISSSAAVARSTAVTAVRFSLVERSEKLDEILLPEISPFLELIGDPELDVKQAAVLALIAAARNKPHCIKDLLPALLPKLYVLTVTKTVHVGGYARSELQATAFECVDTLLDTCLGYFCPSSFMVPYLISGLDDHYNVRILCLSILSKLTEKCPTAVLADIDSLVDPLERTIFFKLEFDAVKYEVDRNEVIIRRALRAVASLLRISGGNGGHKLKNLMFKISTHSIRDKYASICSEL